MRYIIYILVIISFLSCKEDDNLDSPIKNNNEPRQLSEIIESGRLKAITTYSGTTYFYTVAEPWVLNMKF